jgi:hypothetical protein
LYIKFEDYLILIILGLGKYNCIPYRDIKGAFVEVKSFLEAETGSKVASLKTRIDGDLGCAGDDNYDLIDKFITKYSLDYAGFDYSKHFLSEGEISPSLFFPAIVV